MATHTIFVPGTDCMKKFCQNIFLKKIWLSRKNCDCLETKIAIKLVCPKLTYPLNESEMKRNKGKKENYCVVTLTWLYKTEFQITWSGFCRSIDHDSRLWGYDWLWRSIILYRSSCVLTTLIASIIHVRNLFVLDYSKSHASSKFIPYFSEENRWETEQSYYNVSNITHFN